MGTNFRVCSVTLNGDSTYTSETSDLVIPQNLTRAKSASDLFAFIATEIKGFLEVFHPDRLHASRPLSLGFCFSFPFYQASINSGVLIRWVKGFDIEDAIGKDVCQLLQTELDNVKIPVKVCAIVNDTLGSLMARSYTLPVSQTRTSIGAIIGHNGTNGAYLEKLSKVSKDIGQCDRSTGEMFFNIEWGSFDDKLSILSHTEYDQSINESSSNKDSSMFEKRISGIFLGELLRLVVEKLYDDPSVDLFPNYKRNDKSLTLRNRWTVDNSIMAVAETDRSMDLNKLKDKIALTFGFPAWAIKLEDVQAVRDVSKAIGRRAARLAGVAVGAVILQSGKLQQVDRLTMPAVDAKGVPTNDDNKESAIDEEEVSTIDVAIEGDVFKDYPRFEQYMREALRVINGIGIDGEQRVRIGLVGDGSAIGTAIVALLASQPGG